MSRYKKLFNHCKQQKRIAFIPFVMLGDPNLGLSLKIVKHLIDTGADALELGVPVSKPTADGPLIQASANRALQQGVTLDVVFELVEAIRYSNKEIPIGLLVYRNIIEVEGINAFYLKCKKADVDSVLVPDVPDREADAFNQSAQKHAIESIYILSPDVSENEFNQIAKRSRGYIYIKGRAGVTGIHAEAKMPPTRFMKQLGAMNTAPSVLGFGVFKPEHVTQARECGFSGVICGSAIVAIIEKHQLTVDELLNQLRIFVSMMKKASYLSGVD
jgi:tryptophan synthase alpha chain